MKYSIVSAILLFSFYSSVAQKNVNKGTNNGVMHVGDTYVNPKPKPRHLNNEDKRRLDALIKINNNSVKIIYATSDSESIKYATEIINYIKLKHCEISFIMQCMTCLLNHIPNNDRFDDNEGDVTILALKN